MIRQLLELGVVFLCRYDIYIYAIAIVSYGFRWVVCGPGKEIHIDYSFRAIVGGLTATSILLPGGFLGLIIAREGLAIAVVNNIIAAAGWFVWSILVALFALTTFPTRVKEGDEVASGAWIPIFGAMQTFAIFLGASRLLCAIIIIRAL